MSENLHDVVAQVNEVVGSLLADPTEERRPSDADVSALLQSAVRLYSAVSDGFRGGPPPSDLQVSPTEACTVAAALLRSQLLTPFEFAIWFSGGMELPAT